MWFDFFFRTLFLVLPFVLAGALFWLWLYFIRARYIKRIRWVNLEIKIPKEITKTIQAMEVVLTAACYQTWDGDNLLIGQWLQGQLRSWCSLELVSLGGEIHFIVRTTQFFRNVVEAQIYAQYPEVEIAAVPDYVDQVNFGLPGSDWKLWGTEFKFAKEDAYPIKTYVHYEKESRSLDKGEERVDPMTATLEFLGSLNPEEQVWIQILVMASKKRFRQPGRLWGRVDWKEDAAGLIKKLKKEDKKRKGPGGEEEAVLLPFLSPGERKVLEEVERSIAKPGFDCGIRVIYLAPADRFNAVNIVGLTGAFKQYNSADLNGFKPSKHKTLIKYPWYDPTGWRLARKRLQMFDSYRRRAYFYPPYKHQPMVLNSEELATIYHFPGRVALTPTLAKIESKRGGPPVNLPV